MHTSKGGLMTPLDAALYKGNRGCAKYLQLHGGVPANKLTSQSAALRGVLNRGDPHSDQVHTPDWGPNLVVPDQRGAQSLVQSPIELTSSQHRTVLDATRTLEVRVEDELLHRNGSESSIDDIVRKRRRKRRPKRSESDLETDSSERDRRRRRRRKKDCDNTSDDGSEIEGRRRRRKSRRGKVSDESDTEDLYKRKKKESKHSRRRIFSNDQVKEEVQKEKAQVKDSNGNSNEVKSSDDGNVSDTNYDKIKENRRILKKEITTKEVTKSKKIIEHKEKEQSKLKPTITKTSKTTCEETKTAEQITTKTEIINNPRESRSNETTQDSQDTPTQQVVTAIVHQEESEEQVSQHILNGSGENVDKHLDKIPQDQENVTETICSNSVLRDHEQCDKEFLENDDMQDINSHETQGFKESLDNSSPKEDCFWKNSSVEAISESKERKISEDHQLDMVTDDQSNEIEEKQVACCENGNLSETNVRPFQNVMRNLKKNNEVEDLDLLLELTVKQQQVEIPVSHNEDVEGTGNNTNTASTGDNVQEIEYSNNEANENIRNLSLDTTKNNDIFQFGEMSDGNVTMEGEGNYKVDENVQDVEIPVCDSIPGSDEIPAGNKIHDCDKVSGGSMIFERGENSEIHYTATESETIYANTSLERDGNAEGDETNSQEEIIITDGTPDKNIESKYIPTAQGESQLREEDMDLLDDTTESKGDAIPPNQDENNKGLIKVLGRSEVDYDYPQGIAGEEKMSSNLLETRVTVMDRETSSQRTTSFEVVSSNRSLPDEEDLDSDTPRSHSRTGADSQLQDSGFEPSPRRDSRKESRSRIPRACRRSSSHHHMDAYSDSRPSLSSVSVTQAVQHSMRKYHLERRIFHELLELKRLQIRAGRANEAVLVKRLVDDYRRAGLCIGLKPYEGVFTFGGFERYLYDQLRLLQSSDRRIIPRLKPSDDMEKLTKALRRTRAGNMILDNVPENPIYCTHGTHRCYHATHAYTGIPCAAYIAKFNHHTMPKPSGQPSFLPRIDSGKHRVEGQGAEIARCLRYVDPSRPVTLELSHGLDRQVISLPTEKLDKNKRYYVTFTIKGGDTKSADKHKHQHAKSF